MKGYLLQLEHNGNMVSLKEIGGDYIYMNYLAPDDCPEPIILIEITDLLKKMDDEIYNNIAGGWNHTAQALTEIKDDILKK